MKPSASPSAGCPCTCIYEKTVILQCETGYVMLEVITIPSFDIPGNFNLHCASSKIFFQTEHSQSRCTFYNNNKGCSGSKWLLTYYGCFCLLECLNWTLKGKSSKQSQSGVTLAAWNKKLRNSMHPSFKLLTITLNSAKGLDKTRVILVWKTFLVAWLPSGVTVLMAEPLLERDNVK